MFWQPYVSVAKKKENAKKLINKLLKRGHHLLPVSSTLRTIACSFWGKKWCRYIERFADYDHRFSRGRSYIKSDCVIHLSIEPKKVTAKVLGSTLYEVTIDFKPLPFDKWEKIKSSCRDAIHSMIDLISGEIPDFILSKILSEDHGLLPKQQEIHCHCDCGDCAIICKHVAATLYGIGVRLDEDPSLFFTLRNVNPTDLIQISPQMTEEEPDIMGRDEMEALFNISSDQEEPPLQELSLPQIITGHTLKKVRKNLKITAKECAFLLSTTPANIYRWEKNEGALKLPPVTQEKLEALIKIPPQP